MGRFPCLGNLRCPMGSENLFWKRKRRLERSINQRCKRPSILIVCEGQKTEPEYFKSFPVTSLDVHVMGTGYSTKSLVEVAIEKNKESKQEATLYDQVWCVFDKDSFSKQDFNGAIQKAESNGLKVAYSNEAFELWYVLHFEYLTAAITRKRYNSKLTAHLKRKYEKNDPNMYETLLSQQFKAVKHSKRLLKQYVSTQNPADKTPATTVFLYPLKI